jgi:hypothetical protein
MQIRIRETGQVMHENELRLYLQTKDGTSFEQLTSEVMEDIGVDPVLEGAQATGGTVYQYSQAIGVEQLDGKWYTKHTLGPIFTDRPEKTAAQQEAEYKAVRDVEQPKSVRQMRNDKLKDSDWTQVADASVDQAAWATYRQALRDITAQSGFPWGVIWPTQPE